MLHSVNQEIFLGITNTGSAEKVIKKMTEKQEKVRLLGQGEFYKETEVCNKKCFQ